MDWLLKTVRISIHAPREGGDGVTTSTAMVQEISIHAPREGGDARGGYTNIWMHISIHAPREGGDSSIRPNFTRQTVFQSTPPARGATVYTKLSPFSLGFQSTPPARGATPTVFLYCFLF